MTEQTAPQPGAFAPAAAQTSRRSELTTLFQNILAGLIAALVLLANIVSFAALMFPGDLRSGFPIAIWALLVGSCIGGAWIALTTSIKPLASGIDSPTGAVLVVLSAMTGTTVLERGGSPEQAVHTALLLFTTATALSGVVLLALGLAKLGTYLRFIPYFVVGGFLAATGWFLVAGGLRMTTGHALTIAGMVKPWTIPEGLRLAAAVGVLAALLLGRFVSKSALTLPLTLVALWALVTAGLKVVGASQAGPGWYFPDMGNLHAWVPLFRLTRVPLDWSTLAGLAPEVIAVAIVSLISLVTKVSSIEVARNITNDLDRELRSHGVGNLLAVPFGGFATSLQIGTSKLLEQAGGPSRTSGVVAAACLGVVALSSFDVQAYVPTVLIGGLVLYLGYGFIIEALARPIAQRAWYDVALALLIATACVNYGFVVGIVAGIIFACLLFAFNYARIGVVRRYATRAQFASYVHRSDEALRQLRQAGEAVQIYWLSGYIFFGSAERLFERIRLQIDGARATKAKFIVLDFSDVPGADSSAVLTLLKLRNLCQQRGIAVICCGMAAHSTSALEKRGLFGKGRHKIFSDLNTGLSYCEEELLAEAGIHEEVSDEAFQSWLGQQLGAGIELPASLSYFEKKVIDGSQLLYRQSEAAQTVDLVAAGNLVVHVDDRRGGQLRIRRFSTHTVIGEMGFYRKAARSASISTDGGATLYTLTRANFDRMRKERPDLAMAFDDFIIRTLADRLEFANKTVDALTH